MSRIRIGTRGSRLALWQSENVADSLRAAHPGLDVELCIIKTIGDRVQDRPLEAIGQTGLFTKELERALLDDEVDIAVHSLKDLPSILPDGLVLAATPERADPRDALVSTRYASAEELPERAILATGSPRRRALFRELRPNADFRDLRGNIGTRLEKLESEGFDGIVMAVAALERLGLGDRVTEALPADRFVPSPGQGTIGIEARDGDTTTIDLMAAVSHADASAFARAERSFQHRLEGGCSAALGAWCRSIDGHLVLTGYVGEREGDRRLRETIEGPATEPETLGIALADRFLAQGAAELVAS